MYTMSYPKVTLNGMGTMTLTLEETTALHSYNPYNQYDQALGAVIHDISSTSLPSLTIVITNDVPNVLSSLTQIDSVGTYEIEYIAIRDGAPDISSSAVRTINIIDDPLMSHSVQFSATEIDFDVLTLSDISTSLTNNLTFKDLFYQEGFGFTDSSAIAQIDMSASDFDELFKLNITIYDASSTELDLTQVRYFTDVAGWPDVSFSQAIVTLNNINAFHVDQRVKKDYARSMIKDITGTTRVNSLFTNQGPTMAQIEDLDASLNGQIREILGYITDAGLLTDADYGAYDNGAQNYAFTSNNFVSYTTDLGDQGDVSAGYNVLKSSRFSAFNPLRILSSSILGEDDASGSDAYDISGTGLGNQMRRDTLMADLSNQAHQFWDISARNITYLGVDSVGISYDVWLENNYTAQQATNATIVDGSKFSEYLKGYKLYAEVNASSTGADLIDEVVDKKYDFKLLAGDSLHMIVEYSPPSATYNLVIPNATVKNRKYEIIINMN